MFSNGSSCPSACYDCEAVAKQMDNSGEAFLQVGLQNGCFGEGDGSDGSTLDAQESNPPRGKHVLDKHSMFHKPTVCQHLLLSTDTLQDVLATRKVCKEEGGHQSSKNDMSGHEPESWARPSVSLCASKGRTASDAGGSCTGCASCWTSTAADLGAEPAGSFSGQCPSTVRKRSYNHGDSGDSWLSLTRSLHSGSKNRGQKLKGDWLLELLDNFQRSCAVWGKMLFGRR